MSASRHPFYNPLDPTQPKIWPNYTLLMPVCAVGNIGQLACDLIISTLLSKQQCQLVGRLYSPALMPVVGPNAFASKGPLTTSSEIYESKQHKLIIIQQRTSYYKSLKTIYIQEMVKWIKEAQFDNVLVLTSSFGQCNPDTTRLADPTSYSVYSITSSLFEPTQSWLNLKLKPIPDKKSIKVVKDGLSFLPGSGLTKPLIRAFERAFIRAAFLVNFCSEGINICESYQLADIVDQLLNLTCSKLTHSQSISPGTGGDICHPGWVEPYSWLCSQY